MQQVFTDQNIAVVGSVKSYLESHGLSCQLRNEFSSSVMGEVAFFDVWPEVWVADADVSQAKQLVDEVRQPIPDGPQWNCAQCQESNPGSFEICWQCGQTQNDQAPLA